MIRSGHRYKGSRSLLVCLIRHQWKVVILFWVFALLTVAVVVPRRSGQLWPVSGQVTTDLARITDAVNELVAESSFLSIHHGIYNVTSFLGDGSGDAIRFAFKTECRPASQWHGQQGWAEVALYHFQRLFYAEDVVAYPRVGAARGVVIAITQEQLESVVHKDGCGVLRNDLVASMETALGGKKLLRGVERGGNRANSNATVLLLGVALTWQDKYDDDEYPSASVYAPYFAVPPSSNGVQLGPRARLDLYEMTDIFVLDYLLLNPDRNLEKNWFTDRATRTHSGFLDNGWGFAGENYKTSVCEVESVLLQCPSLLQAWVKRQKWQWKCASRHPMTPGTETQHQLLRWCRFRPETLVALNRTRMRWYNEQNPDAALAKRWVDAIRSDILLVFLLYTYGESTSRKGLNMALSRYVHKCPPPVHGAETGREAASLYLMRLLEYGVHARMDRLAAHARECLVDYGEAYVYGRDVKS
ncbi:putative glycogenin glucosyltransferase [Trypanosoma grayi]|uniref:putative glycogenin glucosyltransferase n=1 Tax=Trypanosoma grayi TaxID=71804 RepID=UPI0004F44329|nr:putative glycogenin glucosyltransferase [Trypanosoma grayi]KEG10418.1 putative glycogenin glucosyltransferase [Trypanosoma grayi]